MTRIAIYQFDVSRGDVATNIGCIEEAARKAVAKDSSILFLPEMCTTGFDWEQNRKLLDESGEHIERIGALASSEGISICGSFLEKTEKGNAANTVFFFDKRGRVLGKYRKAHLFTLFHEERHVEAGDDIVNCECAFGQAGLAVCYDLRFPELFRKNTLAGAVAHVIPAAFPHPRLNHWRTLIVARAIENQSFVIATNQCGFESHGSDVGKIQYFGHSMVVDPWGEILFEADETEGLHVVEVDFEEAARVRRKLTALQDRRPELY